MLKVCKGKMYNWQPQDACDLDAVSEVTLRLVPTAQGVDRLEKSFLLVNFVESS